MGPVTATERVIDSRLRQHPSTNPARGDGGAAAPARALVPLGHVGLPADRIARLRPSSAFLAQLIAANRNLPQARERRRAEPHEAIAAYAATARAA
jgi:hypothetical protein